VLKRIAVLASGSGSNLEALFAYQESLGARRSGTVAVVASDRPDARALERARARGVPTAFIGDPSDPRTFDRLFGEHAIDLVVFGGYLKLVPPEIVRRFRGRAMNVHPTLLPAFGGPGMYGLRAHRAVIASGARVTGVSVHFVDEMYDQGPLIAQWPVPVMGNDSPESLAERVLRVEHVLYPRVVEAVAGGRIVLDASNRVTGSAAHAAGGTGFLLAPFDAAALAATLDRLLQS
jgi:formyltetrahydrofolate-dependent phosphoribosylglycinamide formyltransferase